MLGACRQMYEEASSLLWTTNTFSFDSPVSLKNLMNDPNSVQIRKLSSIHIDMRGDEFWPVDWDKSLSMGLLKKFSGLQTLHTNFNQSHFDSRKEAMIETELSLWKMQVLPLKHVTVSFGNGEISEQCYGRHPRSGWTIEEWREVVEELRLKLLNPKGPKVFAAERIAKAAAREEAKGREEAEKVVRTAEHEERKLLQLRGHR